MKNKLTKCVIALAVLGLMTTGLAYAESGGEKGQCDLGNGRGGKGKQGKFLEGLNLTDEQKAKLKEKREADMESVKAAREQLKVKMQALYAEISKPETKREDVSGLVSEVSTLKGQMFVRKVDGVFAMKEVLTPEQFAKMQEHRKEQMGKRGGRMKGRWGKGRDQDQQTPR